LRRSRGFALETVPAGDGETDSVDAGVDAVLAGEEAGEATGIPGRAGFSAALSRLRASLPALPWSLVSDSLGGEGAAAETEDSVDAAGAGGAGEVSGTTRRG
jgi:hypothetical protein